MNEKLQKYYDYLKAQGAYVPDTYESFRQGLSTDEGAKKYHDYALQNGYYAPQNYDEFAKSLGVGSYSSSTFSPTTPVNKNMGEMGSTRPEKYTLPTQQVFDNLSQIYSPKEKTMEGVSNPLSAKLAETGQTLDNNEDKKIAEQNLKAAGYDPSELQDNFGNLSPEVKAQLDVNKLMQMKETNPVQYKSAVAGVQVQDDFLKGLKEYQQSNPNENTQAVFQQVQQMMDKAPTSYAETLQNLNQLSAYANKYTNNGDEVAAKLGQYYTSGFDGLLPDTDAVIAADPRSKYFSRNQMLALQKMDYTNPGMAQAFKNLELNIDTKTLPADTQTGLQYRQRDLDYMGIQQRMDGISQQMNALSSNPAPTDEDKTKYQWLSEQYNAAKADAEGINKKYPLAALTDANGVAQELLGESHNGLARFMNTMGIDVANVAISIPELIMGGKSFFTGQGQNDYLLQLRALGMSKRNELETYTTIDKQMQQAFRVDVNPEFQKTVDGIKADESLTLDEKTKKLAQLIADNPDSAVKTAITPKLNLTAKSIFNSSVDFLAHLPVFVGGGELGTALGAGSKLSTFGTIMLTSLQQETAARVEAGDPNPFGNAVISTSINALPFGVLDKLGEYRKLYSPTTAVGKVISQLDDATIKKFIDNPPTAMQNFWNGLGKSAKEGLTTSIKLSLAGTAGSVANKALSGQPITPEEVGKELALSTISQLIPNTFIGGMGQIRSGNISNLYQIAHNGDYYREQINKMVESGRLTPEAGDKHKAVLDNVREAYDNTPTKDNDEKQLSDRQLLAGFKANLEKNQLERDIESPLPTKLREKKEAELESVQKNEDLIYSTDDELTSRKAEIEKQLQPKPDTAGGKTSDTEKNDELNKELNSINVELKARNLSEPTTTTETPAEVTPENNAEPQPQKTGGRFAALAKPKIESAVIEINGKQYEGKNHAEAILKAKADGQDISNVDRKADGKFKLSDGTIIDRSEAEKQFGNSRAEVLIPQDEASKQADKDYGNPKANEPKGNESPTNIDEQKQQPPIQEKQAETSPTESVQDAKEEGSGVGGDVKEREVLNDVNPTGGVFAEYSASQRDKMPLGENIVTYDNTSGKAPNEIITVYRGVPKEVNEINSGDFVTTNEQLAKNYAGTGKVISKQVRADEILDDKTEPLGEEYILRERPKETKPTISKEQTEQGFTEAKDLNKMFADLKSKYGDKKGAALYEAANRLVNPNKNTIAEIRSNGVVVKEGDKYTLKPFGNTDANSKKWTLYKGLDVTDQFVKSESKKPIKEEAPIVKDNSIVEDKNGEKPVIYLGRKKRKVSEGGKYARSDAKLTYQKLKDIDTPNDARGLALLFFAGGNKITEETFNKEVITNRRGVSLNTGAKEKRSGDARGKDFLSKDGITIDEAAHSIWDNLDEETQHSVDYRDIKNELIDAAANHNTRLEAANDFLDSYSGRKFDEAIEEGVPESHIEDLYKQTPEVRDRVAKIFGEIDKMEFTDAEMKAIEKILAKDKNIDNLDKLIEDLDVFPTGAEDSALNKILNHVKEISRPKPAAENKSSTQNDSGKENIGAGKGQENAATQDDLDNAQAIYDKASRDLTNAENRLAKEQGKQSDIFNTPTQHGLFKPNREDSKSVLDPLRIKVKEAKAELDRIQKEIDSANDNQPSLFQVKSESNNAELNTAKQIIKEMQDEAAAEDKHITLQDIQKEAARDGIDPDLIEKAYNEQGKETKISDTDNKGKTVPNELTTSFAKRVNNFVDKIFGKSKSGEGHTVVLKDSKALEDAAKELNARYQVDGYKGSHSAPDKNDSPLYDLTNAYGDDIYTDKAWYYFGDGGKSKLRDKQSAKVLQSVKGNPEAEVTVYRAVPKNVDEINNGDWVSISKDYAREHGERQFDGKYKILEKKVKAKQVFSNGDSLHEQGIQFMRDKKGEILGFTDPTTGKIYLNGEKLNPNTPVHEAGHLWTSWAKENAPELHKRGLELTDKSKYLRDVKANKFYVDEANKLPENQRENYYREEALATAIGDKGAQFVTEARRKAFADWAKDLWNNVAKAVGFKNVSAKEIQDMTLDEFSKRAAADILKGEPQKIKENNNAGSGKEPPVEKGNAEPDESANPQRSFTKQILKDESILPKDEIAKKLDYVRKTNAVTVAEAAKIIKDIGVEEAFNAVTNDRDIHPAVRVVMGEMLIKKFNDLAAKADNEADKNYFIDKTIATADYVSEKLGTEAGQAIQAFSLYARLTPEGQLRAATKEAKAQSKSKIEKSRKDATVITEKLQKVNEEVANEITQSQRVKSSIDRAEKNRVERAKDKIQKAREKREQIIKKYQSEKGKTLYSTVGLTTEGIEFVGNIAKTYIDEGVANLEILAEKIRQSLKAATNKDIDDITNRHIYDVIKPLVEVAENTKTAKSLKELEKDIHKVIREHYTVPEEAKTTLINKFMDAVGLEEPEATKLAKEIQGEFDRIATRRKMQMLESEKARFDKMQNKLAGAKKTEQKTLQSEAIRLSNMGALDSDTLLDMVAEKLGTGHLTPEQGKEIQRLAEIVAKAPEGSPKNNAVEDLLTYRAKMKGTNWGEVTQGVWYANVLSGYLTHVKNIVSTAMNGLAFFATEVASDPKSLPVLLYGGARGLKRGGVEAWHTITTGKSPIHVSKVELPNILERIKFNGGLLNPANYLKYVGRLMVGEDVFQFQGLKEMRATQLAYREAQKNGYKNPFSRQTWRQINDRLLITHERFLDADAQVKQEGLKGIDAKRRIYELMEQSRPIKMQEDAYGFAAKGTFNHNTEGTLGALTTGISQLLDVQVAGTRPLRFLIPFTRIITNVANNTLDFSPIGMVRAARGVRGFEGFTKSRIVKDQYHVMTTEERRQTVVKASLGIVSMAALYALSKNGTIQITGAGPSDIKKKIQLMQEGWQEYSIKVGDKYYSYKLSPMVFAWGIVGSIRDHENYDKGADEETALQRTTLAAWSGIKNIGDMTWVSSASPIMSALSSNNPSQAGYLLSNTGRSMGKSFIVPNAFTQSAQAVQNIFDMPQKQVNNAYQNLIMDVPIARNTMNDKINALGDPIVKDNDLIYSDETKDPVLKYLLDKKGWVAPVNKNTLIIFDQKTKEDRPATEDEYYNFSKLRGSKIKAALQDILKNGAEVKKINDDKSFEYVHKTAEELTTKELNSLLDPIKTDATKKAKAELFNGANGEF